MLASEFLLAQVSSSGHDFGSNLMTEKINMSTANLKKKITRRVSIDDPRRGESEKIRFEFEPKLNI